MNNEFLKRGKRWSGEKVLERPPLKVLILGVNPMGKFDFIQMTITHDTKDPHSKSKEPDCLFPLLTNLTQALREGKLLL